MMISRIFFQSFVTFALAAIIALLMIFLFAGPEDWDE